MLIVSRSEAKASGLRRYYPGRPCPQGHDAERQTKNGECVECARLAARRRHEAKRDDPAYRAENNVRSTRIFKKAQAARLTKRAAVISANAHKAPPGIEIIDRKAARARGLSRYFTGLPCKSGHVAQRYVTDVSCVSCKELSIRDWRDANRDRDRERSRCYYQSNREDMLARAARFAAANRDNPAHREMKRQSALRWYRANPDKAKATFHLRRSRRLNAPGHHTADDLVRIRTAQRDRCAYCETKLRGKGHLDHIIALARGGTNWPNNLQWLCQPCNSSKHARDPLEFARAIGRLL